MAKIKFIEVILNKKGDKATYNTKHFSKISPDTEKTTTVLVYPENETIKVYESYDSLIKRLGALKV